MPISFYIVSGMSGAGKSQALKIFEDLGFVCIDNMPVSMMDDFANVCLKNPNQYKNVAISIDSRAGKSIEKFKPLIASWQRKKICCKVMFLDCSDSVLIRRFSETRRRHPIGQTIHKSILAERKILKEIFALADEVIDTSEMTMGELKKFILHFAGLSGGKEHLHISVLSFGYKYGIPSDVDIVYDVRFLVNPNYVKKLRNKTGRDIGVKKYILAQKCFKVFFEEFCQLIQTTLPGYIDEGKSYLTIAIGCTGGRHRSVFTACCLADFLRAQKYKVTLHHRDIDK
ncbi:MAG: RNase adapter RapZ [Elusimicrobiota bacterium]|jgi:UPF0042 nucleotide-binding protein|nr:RNase adapter RapZ [Elusimicrobiota bacterium]